MLSAPGKRILSTINHNPSTGQVAPNAYAYASGTSVAVPYVAAEAVLLKTLYPKATNKQLRDRIITSSDNIDDNNLSQCASGSCRGLLGSGRINVFTSLQQKISSVEIRDGDVVKIRDTPDYYYIVGGKRQFITPFVLEQRFKNSPIVEVDKSDLDKFTEALYATPLDGTLVKSASSNTVYYITKGLRQPISFKVFTLRQLEFKKRCIIIGFRSKFLVAW